MALGLLRAAKIPDTTELVIGGVAVAVSVRVNPRARHYRLTVSRKGEPVLTFPASGRWKEAQAFLERNRGWLSKRLEKRDGVARLGDGARVPLRGVEHTVLVREALRGTVERTDGSDGPILSVPGGADHFKRRLVDWFKREARADIEARCAIHAANLGVSIAAIRMRDQSTRWGSCSSTRTLSFNWRLIMAPPYVLDYVAAHEVAHILEMNHAPAYWRTLARTLPDYERGKAWLKANGQSLMAID
ncbi:M48 family metallopeptidase [Pelagibacterium xiamenense]|uniref:M48 family metallopeptidase n=1 Tax=Pelagibacterium xiamenense TaxID=2901140 RepID=UPI001E2BFAEC|nr:SprT family zinc-dependent metalloprotease [Pelagibacterium xiamenense]MCD7058521.1 M48 family metallopeptidase [Pelagibacterium xiamenense]